jgi:phage/plasmid-associated DNA primase
VATANYKAESDLVGQFIAECCVLGEYGRAKATPLYLAFSKWAEGSDGMSQTALSRRIVEKGFEKRHTETGNEYLGIGLLDPHVREQPVENPEGFFDVLRAREKELRKPDVGETSADPSEPFIQPKPFSQRASGKRL